MEIKELYQLYIKNYKVTTDTRADLTNAIFFALKGKNFNGNKYAEQAIENGADYAVVDEKEYQTNDKIILVKDVLTCLQELARFHRIQLAIPIIALTGSNGKTTTKELIYAVLKQKYICQATKGNLNNHIGVPLTILSIKPKTELAVIEMGANHPNEIDQLCEIALPDFGYITNFGKVHLEGFGSLEGVIHSKTEMYRHLKKNKKPVFVNANDQTQLEKSVGMQRITFGDENSDYPVQFISADPNVNIKFDSVKIHSNLIGKYNFMNIATAVAMGQYFNVDAHDIKQGIESYVPSNNRSQIIIKGSTKIILDAYNANPNSMEVALENLAQLTDTKKIAVLGDMFEIGDNSMNEHENIANLAANLGFSQIHLLGKSFCETNIKDAYKYSSFENFKEKFRKENFNDTTVLIKASRGMALERILDLF